eukprot:CAMPEP_0198156170 /NCGR_PEP_ID=MMETSP1443-20131203/69516_1 /TAXON_ID=186043 /ORGANISM="Entomoneis sp., Strain CCMP2396" /LENGTH=1177 /DNA_ID=CAMNT_0043822953 /DNA_START=143 /DNA_END=3677 /DNA_ORIENTATION=+
MKLGSTPGRRGAVAMATRVVFCSLMIVKATPWMNLPVLPSRHRALSFTSSSRKPLLQLQSTTEDVKLSSSSGTTTDKDNEATMSADVEILADDDIFLKPERDGRQYRMIKLKQNNLKVLLVSDQMAEGDVGVEAASVHVQAGHYDDTIPGLAHFHEHMLFLGTAKYPKEDEYENYLTQYGGGSANAYTDMEDTNYYFSITTENKDWENKDSSQTTEGLTGALDRLAQFFIKPNFDPDAVDRETRAIDSEYRNGKTSDSWRNYQALKSFANQSHPFAKFGCGNLETLTSQGTDVLLKELQNFWDTYYQSYNLRLAVVGHGSLDALQKTVQETFGGLPFSEGLPRYEQAIEANKAAATSTAATDKLVFEHEGAVYGVHAFGPEQLGIVRSIVPLIESRSVKVHFAVPPLDDPLLRDTRPYRVLSHLLGHESPGSLHSLLNDEGYLNGLSSGIGIESSDFSLFSISISLTPKGMANKDKVLDLLFQWIALLRQNQDQMGPYHDEMRQISNMGFKFRENSDPSDFCSGAADLLFAEHAEPSEFLCGSSLKAEHDPVITEAFLDRLRPETSLIVITNSDLKQESGDEWTVEPWYGAPHKDEPMDPEQMKSWESPPKFDERLQLPELNAYIPNDFTLRCDEGKDEESSTSEPLDSSEILVPPVPLVDNDRLRLWHKMDKYWRVPKAFIRLSIMSPDVYQSPRTMTYHRIFQRILNDDLNSFVYDASLAGCNYRVSCAPSGYRLSVNGYSQKLPFLLDTLTSRLFSLVDEMKAGDPALKEKFDQAREGLCRETKNYRLDSPYEVANYNSRLLMEENVWYLDNYIDEMEGPSAERAPLTMEECADVAKEGFSSRIKCEALCMGNMNSEEAMSVADLISDKFLASSRALSDVEIPHYRSLKMPTRDEASKIFGPKTGSKSTPLVYADIAYSESEENSSVELILQAGSELEMGYEGLAIFDLITHIAYNSAYNQLRTVEQLGYIVSVSARRTAGSAWSMTVIVQGSVASPDKLEERVEAWLQSFRKELAEMTAEEIASEASAVAAQLLESDTKLSQEVSAAWGEILNTEDLTKSLRTPSFDRLEKLSKELLVDEDCDEEEEKTGLTGDILKGRVLTFFDKWFAAESPDRRALSARLYSQKFQKEFEAVRNEPGVVSSFADIRHLKQFLSSWPTAPYWRIDESTLTEP